jgi:5-methylcytosine-specific restriction enzyme B
MRTAGLQFGVRHDALVRTAITSLATKGFLILTGLSGSGKTRLAIAIGEWLGEGRLQVIAVRPDWTGPDALLGYENGLTATGPDGRHAWSVPESLAFMLTAARNPNQPYLLLLDEMNLAHVERYFADVLSGMESGKRIIPNLEFNDGEWRSVGEALAFPKNLFIVGTVNVDETTYMFSPKVLDRANTLEFRVAGTDLQSDAKPIDVVEPGEASLVARFLHDATERTAGGNPDLVVSLKDLHDLLAKHDREFGHRVFYEALQFGSLWERAGGGRGMEALDLQVLQKILPRFHGSIRQIARPLNDLGAWCFYGPGSAYPADFDPPEAEGQPALPLSFDKIKRMVRRLRANHFVGFAE